MANLSPITAKQAQISVGGCPGFWSSSKGGDPSRDAPQYHDTTTGNQRTVVGMSTVSDLVLVRPYDPIADATAVKWISDQFTKKTSFSVTAQPVEADQAGTKMSGAPNFSYANCILKSYKLPQWDREGSEVAKLEITVAVNDLPTVS